MPLQELQKMRTLRPISDGGLPGLELHYGSPDSPRAMWVELPQVRSACTCSFLLAPPKLPSLPLLRAVLLLPPVPKEEGVLHFQAPKGSLVPARGWCLIMGSDLWGCLTRGSRSFWGKVIDPGLCFDRPKSCTTRLL